MISLETLVVLLISHDDLPRNWRSTTAISLSCLGRVPDIPIGARWSTNGVVVAGGNGQGAGLNQLYCPHGIAVSDDNTVYVADRGNNRIVAWRASATTGVVVVDGLSYPTDVTVDGDSLVVCATVDGTRRVTRWPRQKGQKGETLVDSVACWGVTMDDNGGLYVTDVGGNDTVRRYRLGETTVVAGGHGRGAGANQFSWPGYIAVDREQTVYVSDRDNNRVMKWSAGATAGVVVAGGQGQGNSLQQLSAPTGVVVDSSGIVYVAESGNNRVTRWTNGTGTVVVSGLSYPTGLCFDRQGNLYVAENGGHRVLRYAIEK